MARIAVILPGLGRVHRGAEAAFSQIAQCLARFSDMHVEAFGSGHEGPEGVVFHHVPCVRREWFEHWPRFPGFRNECYYEELTFVLGLIATRRYRPKRFDVAISCSYPYINWYLQWTGRKGGPRQIFVTENGDWMCRAGNREYRYFGCDGLVCFNPEYYDRNRDKYRTELIPNGVDPAEFCPASRLHGAELNTIDQLASLPDDRPIVLMASALIPSKRVAEGIQAVARVPEAFLLLAGDGPQREEIARLAEELLPGRHLLLGSIPSECMPALFRRADVFLHMSLIEPFGIVYLEAAATGLPIVAPDLDCPRWILGNTALYADPENLDSVASAVRMAIEPDTAEHLSTAARLRVLTDWTWEAQARRYRRFILDLIGQSAEAKTPAEADRDLDHYRQLQDS